MIVGIIQKIAKIVFLNIAEIVLSTIKRRREGLKMNKQNKQEAKADAGKPKLSMVPRQIIYDIAGVREYGAEKYGDPDNWKRVEKQRYIDAAFRHFLSYLDDPGGRDEESGLPHLSHLACNIAFLCEMEGRDDDER